mgnify:CR=1 FL=1
MKRSRRAGLAALSAAAVSGAALVWPAAAPSLQDENRDAMSEKFEHCVDPFLLICQGRLEMKTVFGSMPFF